MSEGKSGEAMCYVAKGKCGHYYYAAVDLPELNKSVAKEVAEIIARGDVIERKTVQWVRDGGLDWTDACRKKTCATPSPTTTLVAQEAHAEVGAK